MKNEKKTDSADENDVPVTRSSSLFGEVEDVISIGALMRPTVTKAMQTLSEEERLDLKEVLLKVETILSQGNLSYTERFQRVREGLVRTYRYGPIWRFISGKIEECWTCSASPNQKEFAMVSLLFGMIFEELGKKQPLLTQNFAPKKRQAV